MFVGVLLLLTILSVVVVRQSRMPSIEVVPQMLQNGDIIFVDLYAGWCTATYWDHVGLYIEADGSQGFRGAGVIEATYNGGITFTPVRSFLQRDAHAEMHVKRLKDVADRQGIIDAAAQHALDQVSKPFNFTATASIPLKINPDNFHCGEIVWRAFLAAGLDLDTLGGPFIYPDDIYYHPWLESVDHES